MLVTPAGGEIGQMEVATGAELLLILLGGDPLIIQIAREPVLEPVVGKLLHGDRREPDGDVSGEALGGEILNSIEYRQIRIGGGVVEHVAPMRPGAMTQDIRDVAVEDHDQTARAVAHLASLLF